VARRCHPPHRRHRRYQRTLQQRLFRWFGAAIATSGAVVFIVLQWLGGSPTGKRDYDLIRSFAQNRYAEVWRDPARRARLTDELANELDLSVRVVDPAGVELYRNGPPCQTHKFDLAIKDGAQKLGDVELCRANMPWAGLSRFLLVPFAAVFVLWLASVMIARRLGRPLDALARVAVDIGDGKLARRYASRRRDTQEVRVLGDAINDMAQRIGKQLDDQRALLAAVSHELRSPLARMRVIFELLTREVGARPELVQLDDEVKQVDHLVGDLLASARTDFSALAVRRIDLTQLALEAFDELDLDPTTLDVTTPDGHAFVDGDATLLSRALQNLLQNAVRHGGGVHCLRIAAGDRAGELRVEVEDDGPGIPVGEEALIFEPFFRARSTQGAADTSSVGLGLSLVRRIAEAHGGHVFAARRDPHGSRIGFTLEPHKAEAAPP
jgi:two-component system, OmpR family, sensor kinase